MKKAIVFIICLLVVIYATVAVLLIDFNGFGSSARADAWLTLHYRLVDNDGNEVTNSNDPAIATQSVPLFINKETGILETRARKTKFEGKNLLAYQGHDFDRWWIGNTAYAAGAWIPAGLTGNIIEVFPSWIAKSFRVTFDPMGGTPTPNRADVTHGQPYGDIISANSNITRPNFEFEGWWTERKTGGERVWPSTPANIAHPTLFARWIGENESGTTERTFTFYGHGATSGSMADIKGVMGGTIALTPYGFQKTGHRFEGWAVSAARATAGVADYPDMATINVSNHWNFYGHGNLYAVWSPLPVTPDQFTITFNANGGNISAPASETVVSGSTIILPNYTGTRSGYTFGGWNTNSSGTGTTYAVGSSFTVTTTRTLYAKWNPNDPVIPQPITVTVSFDSNGGSTRGLMSVTVGQAYGTNGNLGVPVREGFRFLGWHTSAGTLVTNASIVTISSNHTLRARWENRTTGVIIY